MKRKTTKAIELGTARVGELEALLGETLAKIKELKSKRKATQEEQYKDQVALDEAEELRMKENKVVRSGFREYHRGAGECSPCWACEQHFSSLMFW